MVELRFKPSDIGTVPNGLDVDKPEFPSEGDKYFATDTKILYIGSAYGVWEGVELS